MRVIYSIHVLPSLCAATHFEFSVIFGELGEGGGGVIVVSLAICRESSRRKSCLYYIKRQPESTAPPPISTCQPAIGNNCVQIGSQLRALTEKRFAARDFVICLFVPLYILYTKNLQFQLKITQQKKENCLKNYYQSRYVKQIKF